MGEREKRAWPASDGAVESKKRRLDPVIEAFTPTTRSRRVVEREKSVVVVVDRKSKKDDQEVDERE